MAQGCHLQRAYSLCQGILSCTEIGRNWNLPSPLVSVHHNTVSVSGDQVGSVPRIQVISQAVSRDPESHSARLGCHLEPGAGQVKQAGSREILPPSITVVQERLPPLAVLAEVGDIEVTGCLCLLSRFRLFFINIISSVEITACTNLSPPPNCQLRATQSLDFI